MQTDPILYAGGMNLYAYVGADPVNVTDPLGLQDDAFRPIIRAPTSPSNDDDALEEIIVTGRVRTEAPPGCPVALDCGTDVFALFARGRSGYFPYVQTAGSENLGLNIVLTRPPGRVGERVDPLPPARDPRCLTGMMASILYATQRGSGRAASLGLSVMLVGAGSAWTGVGEGVFAAGAAWTTASAAVGGMSTIGLALMGDPRSISQVIGTFPMNLVAARNPAQGLIEDYAVSGAIDSVGTLGGLPECN